MEILLLNVANNITDFRTVSSGETVYLKQMLEQLGHGVTIASNKNGEYAVAFEEIEDINNFDKVVVLPASLNFFGGVENPTIIKNYKLLAKYNGTINILQTDARLPFKQLWPAIEKRGWGYKKEEVWINAPIKVIAQSKNLNEVKTQYEKEIFNDIEFTHFPIERYAGIVALMNPIDEVEEKEHDLVYYGSFRGGNRAAKMAEFLCGNIVEKLDVHVFGTIREKQLAKSSEGPFPSFGKKMKMNEIRQEVSKSFSTLIIGEKFYNNAMLTVRVWETLSSDAVVLIDNDFDSYHNLFPNSPWRYVEKEEDLIEVVKSLKDDENKRKLAIQEQKEVLEKMIDSSQWLRDFENILA